MKTHKHLFPAILDFGNLYQAAHQARKGKPETQAQCRFFLKLESQLLRLQDQLESRTYQPGSYRTFRIYDPKERLISAAPFRDRVVHHALCHVIEPIFERTFISDSYANRKGKGTHLAIERYQQYARKYPYVLKCDVRKFFPSLDHAILKKAIRRKIACKDTLWLVDRIIDASNPQEKHEVYFPGDDLFTPQQRRKGLPIGNLTSQFWANVYMNRLDHVCKEKLRVPGYIRYVDDFVLFADGKESLHQWREAVEQELSSLRLRAHPDKTQIFRTDQGVPFLGFQVYPYRRFVQKAKTKRHFRHLKNQVKAFRAGEIDHKGFTCSLNSWLGHIRFGRYQSPEKRVFDYLCNEGVRLTGSSGVAWRVVEQ